MSFNAQGEYVGHTHEDDDERFYRFSYHFTHCPNCHPATYHENSQVCPEGVELRERYLKNYK